MCIFISSDPAKTALLCYSFLIETFSDVACVRVNGIPVDFQKVYLPSRHELHPQVVAFIDFMARYRFQNALDGAPGSTAR